MNHGLSPSWAISQHKLTPFSVIPVKLYFQYFRNSLHSPFDPWVPGSSKPTSAHALSNDTVSTPTVVSPQFLGWKLNNAQGGGTRRWAFRGWLGHEGGAPLNGVSALKKQTSESSISPSSMWGQSNKSMGCGWEESPPKTPTMLAPWFWTCSLQNHEK